MFTLKKEIISPKAYVLKNKQQTNKHRKTNQWMKVVAAKPDSQFSGPIQ